jgi:hypothetical protein
MKDSMLLVTSVWDDKETFRMIPVTETCPYVECIFDTGLNVMVIISKNKKQSYHMLPKLDDNGDLVRMKVGKRDSGKDFKEERRLVESFQEHYVINPDEVENVISMFAINKETFDYKKYMNQKPATTEEVSGAAV